MYVCVCVCVCEFLCLCKLWTSNKYSISYLNAQLAILQTAIMKYSTSPQDANVMEVVEEAGLPAPPVPEAPLAPPVPIVATLPSDKELGCWGRMKVCTDMRISTYFKKNGSAN